MKQCPIRSQSCTPSRHRCYCRPANRVLRASNKGKPVVLRLLDRNSPSWRRRYANHFVALSAPWGGNVDEMLTFASGNTLGVHLVNSLIVRGEQRSSESNLWLLPNPKVFNGRIHGSRHGTVSRRHWVPLGVHPYRSRISPLIAKLAPPEIPVTCIVGSGVRTADALFYNDKGFDEAPGIIYGDGDGTVDMVSLLALESLWKGNDIQLLKVMVLRDVTCTSILKDGSALEEIIRELFDINTDMQVEIL